MLEDDYPPVTYILVTQDNDQKHIEWNDVSAINKKLRTIEVADLDRTTAIEEENDVRLRRDVLDALVLDLLGRRTTRVVDLLLRQENGRLHIKGADAGLAASWAGRPVACRPAGGCRGAAVGRASCRGH